MDTRIGALLSAAAISCAGAGAQIPIAFAPAPPAGQVVPAEYVPNGEVAVMGANGATFDDWRVVGPRVNLTRRADGTWAGSILGEDVLLTPGEGTLSGPGGNLNFVRWGKDVLVQGSLGRRQFQIRFQPGPGYPYSGGGILCLGGPKSVDCTEARSQGNVMLRGQAAIPDAPMPQFGLALLATMM
jgi:hypothetical protein